MSMFRLALTAALLALSLGCSDSSNDSPSAPSPSPSPSPTPGQPVSIVRGSSTLTTNAYAPNPIAVATGSTVTWTNNDTTAHTSTATDGSWNSGTMAPGASFSRAFPAPGTFPYHCTLHPGMVGTVVVQ